MALVNADEMTSATWGVNWLVENQDVSGAWIGSDNVENTEVGSEAVQALFDFGDVEGPSITDIEHSPEFPICSDQTVTIYATITDDESGVDPKEVRVKWEYDEYPDEYSSPMFLSSEDVWSGYISLPDEQLAIYDGLIIQYKVYAKDLAGNWEQVPSSYNLDYSYTFDCLAPTADFYCNPLNGNEDLTTTCTSTSDDDVDSDLDHEWTFTGGYPSSSTDKISVVEYLNDGLYTVSLTVTDDAGHFDTETKVAYLEVLDVGPSASFDEDVHVLNEGETVTFTDTSTSHDPILSWLWDFGDETTSEEQSPTHTYADNGIYEVTLTVCDEDNDCDTTDPVIKTVNNEAPNPNAGEYTCNEGEQITLTATFEDVAGDGPWIIEWDLDGDDVFETPGESVNYDCGNGDAIIFETVAVRVTDKDGYFGYDDALITIENVAPIADADGPYETSVLEIVCFDGSASDVIDTSFTYEWDFDYDGETFDVDSIDEDPCATSYSEKRTYTVALRVNDGVDNSEIVTTTVTVYDYNIELDAGWNLVSIPLVPENDDTSINNVLNDVIGKVDVVWSYQQGEWSYFKGVTGELNEIIPGFGYYIKMLGEDTLYLNGEKVYGNNEFTVPRPPVVTLTPSWNLIGHYGMKDNVAKSDALDTLAGSYSTMLDENYYSVLDSGLLIPTEGYWLFLTGTDNLDYAPSEAAYTF